MEDADATVFLSGIQGNIVKGHGRNHTAHLLLKMVGSPDVIRESIGRYACDWVTSAGTAVQESQAWRSSGVTGTVFGMFLLSADGYRHLGFGEDEIPRPEGIFTGPNDDGYFHNGLKKQSEGPRPFNDPPISEWEDPYKASIHAMALIADDSLKTLDEAVKEVCTSFKGVFEVLTIERGDKLTSDFPRGTLNIEHFGFQDGVSQPIMVKQDIEKELSERGGDHWDPSAPLSLTLVPEPGLEDSFGSFMVFRKLEQNVKGFWETLEGESENHGIDLELAGAMAVGRYRDGAPLIPTTTPVVSADPNDFHFDQDASGSGCPFHAHIRKTNPRGDIARVIGASDEFERARRIVRRGITYGDRPDLESGCDAERPESGVGLLFMCFQSNLDQFAIQQEGADSNDFVNAGSGVDAVIGQNESPVDQTWPSTGKVKFTMANFVKMLGGEYFFAPSITFLKSLVS